MVKAFRHPISGATVVCNAGAHTGVHRQPDPDPSAPPDWLASELPGFVSPVPNEIGSVMRLKMGTVIPSSATVEAVIGTGSIVASGPECADFAGPLIDDGGTILDEWDGLQPVARFVASANGLSKTLFVPSGVTVEGGDPPDPPFPAALTSGQWSAVEVRDVAPEGRRRILVNSGLSYDSATFDLVLYSGPPPDTAQPGAAAAVMTPGTAYTTVGTLPVGSTCVNRVWWRRISDGALANPSNVVTFTMQGLEVVTPPEGDFPPVNQTLSSATATALRAALDARVASGSTATWVIHLPSGNYGGFTLPVNYRLPGKTILRSANWPATGAVFTRFEAIRGGNILLSFVKVNRRIVGRAPTTDAVSLEGSDRCGIEYSEVDCGPNVTNASLGIDKRGYAEWCQYGISLENHLSGGVTYVTTNSRVYMNYIHGAAIKGVRLWGTHDYLLAENVFADIKCDDIQHGSGIRRGQLINNWHSRRRWSGGADHTDGIQYDSGSTGAYDNIEIGNVLMFTDDQNRFSPSQGYFSSKAVMRRNRYENNIYLGNAQQGLNHEHGTNGAISEDNIAIRNSCLRLAEGFVFTGHTITVIRMPGTTLSQNVQCGNAGDTGMGPNGLNIVTNATVRTNVESYYTRARPDSSFYDLRPIEGQPTHWDYTGGTRVGAYERFRDVIEGGRYPKIGPAAAAWKREYDPRNQITS